MDVFFKKNKVASCLDEINCNVYEMLAFNDISNAFHFTHMRAFI